MTIQSKLYKNA